MRKVSWESENGRTVVFDRGPYGLKELTSALGGAAETVKAPRQDGATTYHVSLDTMGINLVGSMLIYGDSTHDARAAYDKARAQLHQAFAPNRWGVLTYYKEDEAVRVRCRPVATPTIGTPVGVYSTVDIDFVTDSPYWETAQEFVAGVGFIGKYWTFPWSPVRRPMGSFHRFAAIHNPTEEMIYPLAEVYSTSQKVTLTNRTTGEAVTIEQPIAQGQKLTVDLKDVSAFLWALDASGDYVKQEDVSHWMSLDSVPWGLRPGLNQLAVSNDAPEDTPIAYFKYRIPSLGV